MQSAYDHIRDWNVSGVTDMAESLRTEQISMKILGLGCQLQLPVFECF